MRTPSKPKTALRTVSSSGSFHWAGMASAPVSTPATDPAVAPLESVSRPPRTVSAMVRVKSPSPYRSPAVRTAAFGTVWIQPSPAVSSATVVSVSSQVIRVSWRETTRRAVRASRLLAGMTVSASSTAWRTLTAVNAAETSAAAHIAPYTPFPVWDSTASRRARAAARRGAPGRVQP